jgi:general secretion pathway protein G
MQKSKRGFTLIELLVVIAIIGLLSTLSILALNSARARSRDAKRISDVRQIQTALEMYYNDNADYPDSTASLAPTYIKAVPTPPTPIDGGSCPVIQPSYTYVVAGSVAAGTRTYTLNYCLGATTSGIVGNTLQTATPAGIY